MADSGALGIVAERLLQAFDGNEPVVLKLNVHGGELAYWPNIANLEPGSCFELMEAALRAAASCTERPPKDMSEASGHSQFYADGATNRPNPRWVQAGWPLRGGEQLGTLLQGQASVEAALADGRASPPASTRSSSSGSPGGGALGASQARRHRASSPSRASRYADGSAGVRWHADDEKCDGDAGASTIASVSLGAFRFFDLRRTPRPL